jgi:hypothetical protein
MRSTWLAALACVAVLLFSGAHLRADEGPNVGVPDPISLDRASPSVVTFGNTPGDIYGDATMGMPPGMGWDVGGPGPILHIADVSYGLSPLDNNDGQSNGEANPQLAPVIYFSADDASMGVLGTEYWMQAIRGQAAGDRFVTNGQASASPVAVMGGAGPAIIVGPAIPARPSINLLSLNQDWYWEIPSIRPLPFNTYVPNPNETAMDDMDALELTPIDLNGTLMHDAGDTPIYFTLDSVSPSLGALTGADVLLAPPGAGGFALFAGAGMLGLTGGDEVDALAVYDLGVLGGQAQPGIDFALFSLAPGSVFLDGPDMIPGTLDDLSAADIFVTSFAGTNALYLPALAIGLLPTDNLDALDVETGFGGMPQVFEDEAPEPATMGLLGLGLAAMAVLKRRRRRHA